MKQLKAVWNEAMRSSNGWVMATAMILVALALFVVISAVLSTLTILAINVVFSTAIPLTFWTIIGMAWLLIITARRAR